MPMNLSLGLGLGGIPVSEGVGVPSWAQGTDLWKDFTVPRGTLADPIDTHAATIYAPNAAGLYLPFAPNVLTRSDLGLQTVPTRTNQIPFSRDYVTAVTGSWFKMNITPVLEAGTSRTGGTIHSLTRSSAVASCYMTRAGLTNTVGTVATGWVIAKRKSAGNRIGLRLQGTYPDRADAVFDLAAGTVVGTVGSTYTNLSATMTPLGDDWYLCTLTATVAGTNFTQAIIGPTDGGLLISEWEGASAVLSDCFLSDVQVEVGAFATPPIVTTGTAVTVNGNQQVIDLTGRLGTGVAGIVQVSTLQVGDAGNPRIFTISDGSSNNRFSIYQGATQVLSFGTAGGISQSGQTDMYNPSVGTLLTIAFAYSASFMAMRIVGRSALANTTPTYATGMDRFSVGVGASANIYQYTRKLALDFLAPGDDPATKFAEWYAKAVLAAAA